MIALLQGCVAEVPTARSYFYQVYTPTSTPATPVVCDRLFNGCESLAENGTWGGTNSVRALSSDWFTQGTRSLRATITTASGWNDNILVLTAFAPSNWSTLRSITADFYVDANVVNGAAWSQLQLRVDADQWPVITKYYRGITDDTPTLSAGQQSLTWNISWSADTVAPPLIPTDPITKIMFIYNRSTPSTGQGTGNLYIDNIQFHYCP
jgi:hypothetical protein